VSLLFLRITVIMHSSSPRLVYFLKIVTGIVVLSGFVIVISTGAYFFNTRVSIDVILTVIYLFQGFYMIGVVLMDISTAVIFAKVIREQKKALQNAHTKQDFHQPTDIIASTGLVIALLSLSAALVLSIAVFTPGVVVLTNIGALLWIRMKLRLEKLAEAKNEPPNHEIEQVRKTAETANTTDT
jgi:hypothetical protein